MVVTPDELEDRIWQKEKQNFKQLEQNIDDYLRNHYTGIPSSVRVPLEKTYNIREDSLKKLLKAYEKAGWLYELKRSSYDYDYFLMMEKNPKKTNPAKPKKTYQAKPKAKKLEEPKISEFQEMKPDDKYQN
jgi:hypothetical protein